MLSQVMPRKELVPDWWQVTLYFIPTVLIGQDELWYMQGGRAQDTRDRQLGTWGSRRKTNINIGGRNVWKQHNGLEKWPYLSWPELSGRKKEQAGARLWVAWLWRVVPLFILSFPIYAVVSLKTSASRRIPRTVDLWGWEQNNFSMVKPISQQFRNSIPGKFSSWVYGNWPHLDSA